MKPLVAEITFRVVHEVRLPDLPALPQPVAVGFCLVGFGVAGWGLAKFIALFRP